MLEVLNTTYVRGHGREILEGSLERNLGAAEQQLLPVDKIRYSHSHISSQFRNGPHSGNPISTLADALEYGKVQVEGMVMFGAMLGDMVVTFNNRRLWALKEFQRRCPGRVVKAPIRIFQLCPVTAKFVMAYSSSNQGFSVELLDH